MSTVSIFIKTYICIVSIKVTIISYYLLFFIYLPFFRGISAYAFTFLSFYHFSIPECIPKRERCDGTPQCRDQSDEHRCSCLDRLRSVKPGLVNDGYYDCFDGSDEFVSK